MALLICELMTVKHLRGDRTEWSQLFAGQGAPAGGSLSVQKQTLQFNVVTQFKETDQRRRNKTFTFPHSWLQSPPVVLHHVCDVVVSLCVGGGTGMLFLFRLW